MPRSSNLYNISRNNDSFDDKNHIVSIDIYTDGSLVPTTKGNICGYGIYYPNGELENIAKPFNVPPITNNRAELYAIYKAIKSVVKNFTFDIINIYTDSMYSQNSVTTWITIWKKNGWINSKKKPVENQDIIKKIDKYLQKYAGKINITWVKAHTNNSNVHSINNAKADALAKKGGEMYAKLYL